MICCTEPGLTRPCIYYIYIKLVTCKMGGKEIAKKKLECGQLLLTVTDKRQTPDLSSERAPNREETAKFRQN
jgi:hypothetical protein